MLKASVILHHPVCMFVFMLLMFSEALNRSLSVRRKVLDVFSFFELRICLITESIFSPCNVLSYAPTFFNAWQGAAIQHVSSAFIVDESEPGEIIKGVVQSR